MSLCDENKSLCAYRTLIMPIDWRAFEKFVGEEIPPCVKICLTLSGCDTLTSLQGIKDVDIIKIEKHINQNCSEEVKNLKCCYSDFYKNQAIFKFLPGHATLIEALPKHVIHYQEQMNSQVSPTEKYTFILKELIRTTEANALKDSNHASYSDAVKFFATYIFLMCGRSCYEMLRANLGFPSVRTIMRCISETRTPIVEGAIRAKELSAYLDRMKTTKCVWLSEDGTAIVSRVTYDPKTNQLVGLVLPIDIDTGSPKIFNFIASDAEAIKAHLLSKRSNILYLIMAQPIDEKVPPFVLQMFGTDNKFRTRDVVKRWKLTKNELEKYGIEIVGLSSDGDPKLLSAMCHEITHNPDDLRNYVQDMIHIAVKLRNRLLNVSCMKMGIFMVSIDHLRQLLNKINKSVHGLNYIDVFPVDRQNFKSFEKIVDQRVIEALKEHIKDSDATVKYLEMCDEIVTSFLDFQISPQERLYRIHHAVYFLRIWKNFLKSSTHHTIDKNFITQNAYTGIEINARSMVNLIKRFCNENTPEKFLPTMFDSQTCEKAFRYLRSMGTTNLTRINFSLYELLHMIGRIEAQNDIVHFKLPEECFPNSHRKRHKTKIYDLPSDSEIDQILKNAKEAAIDDARRLGMASESSIMDIDSHEFHSNQVIDEDDEETEGDMDENIFEHDCAEDVDSTIGDPTENILPAQFTTVVDENGQEKFIRKSTLVWILTEPGATVSKDRLRRVQVSKRNEE